MGESASSPDYQLDPEIMVKGIRLFLQPVIDDLAKISADYSSACAEVADAHATQGAGWFGGQGNGEIVSASSSFLNETTWQLQQLAGEQTELLASLTEYRDMLLGHVKWAQETDEKVAQRFRAIERDLTERGR